MLTNEKLNAVYHKTDGCCHICYRKLSFKNYGKFYTKGAWHIEHSIPRAKGGSDHLNNLFPACITCNLEKGVLHKNTIRSRYGTSRAPFNKLKKQRIREENQLAGFIGGAAIGAPFGPMGSLLLGTVGLIIGDEYSPRR